jgi:hypothetical protein
MWTEAWQRLLGRPDALGEVARSSLWGLTAQLRRAGESTLEEDEGQRDCLAVVAALAELAATSTASAVPPAAFVPARARAPRLTALAGEFLADRDVARALGRPGRDIAQAPDSRLWPMILAGLLRLDLERACQFRDRAMEGVRAAGFAMTEPSRVVPMPPWPPAGVEGVLGPDLTRTSRGDAVELVAVGIRFDADGPLDPRFVPSLPSDPDLVLLARIAASYAALFELDDQLWHAPARSSALRASSGEERTTYLNRLADGFHAVLAAESRFATTPNARTAENLLGLWIDLDETFHCLVPLPLCAATSWWSRTKDAVRGCLLRAFDRIRARGVELDLAYRVLKGPYDGLSTQSAGDVRLSGDGPAGQIVACLRVYVESTAGPRPGRVVFIPP